MTNKFPPTLDVGNRVWTESGYRNHGPSEGPKVNVVAKQSGRITSTEQPYSTIDNLLYVICWDAGETSKHYAKDLFCIGRFHSLEEYKRSIIPRGNVELTLGPKGGFRQVTLELEYDGLIQIATVQDRRLWLECLEPMVKQSELVISTKKLKQGEGI